MEEQEADKRALEEKRISVEAKKEEVEERKVALEAQKDELVALKDQLDEQLAERETLMAQLEEEYEELEDYNLTLEEEEAILNAEADSIQKAKEIAEKEKNKLEKLAKERAAKEKAAKNKPSTNSSSNSSADVTTASNSTSSGDFIRPVPNGVTSGFGQRWGKLHAGLDFGSPIGTPVKVAASGNVRLAGSMSGYGTTIMVDHYINGKTYTTLYGHLSSISVSQGQTVSQGQIIGHTGNTGRSTGPHLHFEIHPGGWRNPANPSQFIN